LVDRRHPYLDARRARTLHRLLCAPIVAVREEIIEWDVRIGEIDRLIGADDVAQRTGQDGVRVGACESRAGQVVASRTLPADAEEARLLYGSVVERGRRLDPRREINTGNRLGETGNDRKECAARAKYKLG